MMHSEIFPVNQKSSKSVFEASKLKKSSNSQNILLAGIQN